MITTLLLAVTFGLSPASQTATSQSVALMDGTHFTATVLDGPLRIKTEFGEQRIPFPELQTLRRLDGTAFLVRTGRLSSSGEITRKTFRFQTDVGLITVRREEVLSIRSNPGPTHLSDHSTSALWWMADSERSRCIDHVRNRTPTLK